MKHPCLRLHSGALLIAAALPAWALEGQPPAPAAAADAVVVVSAARSAHNELDVPASVDIVDAARIDAGQPRVNASEALAAVPGLVVQNRQNYAQDLQISSRGFGARSAFGVRGVRLLTDGIPASMPDGQGQAATFNLDLADRIEVLRGPFSALYGNHSGGVVQLFTRDGAGAPALESTLTGGSDGLRKLDVNAQGGAGRFGYLLDASRFETDGYRAHSAARRDQALAKLTVRPEAGGKLAIVASGLRQHDTQDPLGLTWATLQRDPRAGETDTTDPQSPQRTLADRYNTRKSIDHQQIGAVYDLETGAGKLHLMAYGGNRRVVQYQSFSKGFQAPPTHSGGVVDFDRDFSGAEVNWTWRGQLADGALAATVGAAYDHSSDDRKGYENFIGSVFGVRGAPRRDETDTLDSLDPYLQLEWTRGPWVLDAGLRQTRLKVKVRDRYLSNGDDSGGLSFSRTTPVAGVLYKLTPETSVYASGAHGFETPTLNELFYSGSGAGFNFGLHPATSTHLEAGLKHAAAGGTRLQAAVFQVHTRDELVVGVSSGGRTSYRNAARTLRQGLELSADMRVADGWRSHLAVTTLRAIYRDGFGSAQAGSRLPGVPNASAFADVAWTSASGAWNAGMEAQVVSRVYADDANREQPAPGYAVLNMRVGARQAFGGWQLKEFMRLNNLADRAYVGSVIVGDANKRYYEPAPGRQWLAGVTLQRQF